jgi:hypothetical protein
MFTLQPPGIFGAELDTPEADGFIADSDASFGQDIFNITIAKVETIIVPDGITDDVGLESVTLVGIHRPILSNETSLFVSAARKAYSR